MSNQKTETTKKMLNLSILASNTFSQIIYCCKPSTPEDHSVIWPYWLAVWFLFVPIGAHGQTLGKPNPSPAGIGFELGAGAVVSPSYEGSSRYTVFPFPVVRFQGIQFKNGLQFGVRGEEGLSVYPSFGFRASRSSEDDSVLEGLPDVEHSIELGAGIEYQIQNVRAFIELRYGVTGHEGVVGEVGVDWIMHNQRALTLAFGPRLSFASSKYMESYFAVSEDASVNTSLTQFSADAGVKSVGLAADLRYDINEKWAIETNASWDRLIGDAASSPVTKLGDDDQFEFRLGLMRKFHIGF